MQMSDFVAVRLVDQDQDIDAFINKRHIARYEARDHATIVYFAKDTLLDPLEIKMSISEFRTLLKRKR